MLKYQMPWPTGGTVDVYLASDADVAIREANNYWSTFWEKECTARVAAARKQGAEEERAAILVGHEAWLKVWAPHHPWIFAIRSSIDRIKARGAAEPVCTCLGSDGSRHYPDCPYYKPPEPAPLEKIELFTAYEAGSDWGRPSNGALAYKINEVLEVQHALIDRVNRIEARGRP